MVLCKWEELPLKMQNPRVKPYYDILQKKKFALVCKRIFDVIVVLVLILICILPLAIVGILIKIDSEGPIIFRQVRVTQYGREFEIYKFRTMVVNAEKLGAQVTSGQDPRITKVGKKIRSMRLDELPQLFNILSGDMSLVGTRPEVPRFVAAYTEDMLATLLLPAGVTSLGSITFKDEAKIMEGAEHPNQVYIQEVLPQKMEYNLRSLREFSFWKDFLMLFKTIKAVL